MKILRALLRIFFASLLGLVLVIFVVQDDPWIKRNVQESIEAVFNSLFECHFTCKVRSLSILRQELVLESLQARALDGTSWQWDAETTILKISLLPWLTKGVGGLDLTIQGLSLTSSVTEQGLAVQRHLQLLGQKPPFEVPFEVKTVRLRDLNARIYGAGTPYACNLIANGDLNFSSDDIKFSFHMASLKALYSEKMLIDKMQGFFEGLIPYDDISRMVCDIRGQGMVPLLPERNQALSFKGYFKGEHGAFEVKDVSQELCLSLQTTISDFSGELKIPLVINDFAALLRSQFSGNYYDVKKIQAHIDITDSVYGITQIPSAQADLSVGDQGVLIDIAIDPILKMTPVISCVMPSFDRCIGHYRLQKNGGYGGSFSLSSEELYVDGKCGESTFVVQVEFVPSFYIRSFDYYEDGNSVMSGKGTNDLFQAHAEYPIVRSFLQSYGFDMPGEGSIAVQGYYDEQGVHVVVDLYDASIRIPGTYMLVQSAHAHSIYDPRLRKIMAQDVRCDVHKGSITVSSAVAYLDTAYKLMYLHVPCVIRNCLVAIKKDFLAEVHGTSIITYTTPHDFSVDATVVVDNASLRNNVLSAEFQRELMSVGRSALPSYLDARMNISILTRLPLVVKTPFLVTEARCALVIQGSVLRPEVAGRIDLLDGTLNFPYRPLFIKRGRIEFLPQQPTDPLIAITASNSIKNYMIEMNISGSAQSPHISFSSSPPLDQENILGLLLGGSEDGSLSLALPRPVMESVESLVFGNVATSSSVQEYLRNFFKPLRNIRFVPRFSDQSGRGGLRGAVAIEVNDRLRGVIEQNFSLTEDTRLEVDYALSDDTHIRGIKDERGDLGAEIETRWKF